jgi:hypothetical protein
MKTYFRMAGALVAFAALAAAATPALAGPVHVDVRLGTPYPQPVYVQSQPVYVSAQPVYVEPEPIYADQAPVYVYQDRGGWRQQPRWREQRWRERQRREQRWRERDDREEGHDGHRHQHHHWEER